MNSKLDHHLLAMTRVTYVSSASEGGGGRGEKEGRRKREEARLVTKMSSTNPLSTSPLF